MSREQLLAGVAAILTTLAELGGTPESIVYMALGWDLERWYSLKAGMLRAELITCRGNYVEITDKGRQLAAQCETARLS